MEVYILDVCARGGRSCCNVEIIKKKRGEYWYLEPVYGEQVSNVMMALLFCVGVTVVCSLVTGAGHGIMVK